MAVRGGIAAWQCACLLALIHAPSLGDTGAATSASAADPPSLLRIECAGVLRVEDVFGTAQPVEKAGRWQLVASRRGGYVKRPPEFASGCLEPRIEICGCEQGDDAIRCRSLGIDADGTEVAMDFVLDRAASTLRIDGRRQHPRSGQVIETRGLLSCETTTER